MNNLSNSWWSVAKDIILKDLLVDSQSGLSDLQVEEYRKKFGQNRFTTREQQTLLSLALDSVQEPMMIVLLLLAVLSFGFGKIMAAIAMVFEVVIYVILELINKSRANTLMATLKSLSQPTTRVVRNNKITTIATIDVVVGDILILSEGVAVPADARLLKAYGLYVNEASLTGESMPVHKDANAILDPQTVLSNRINAIFSGTVVVSGQGVAVVTAVGDQSELGKIAAQVLFDTEEKTILQKTMDKLAAILTVVAIVMSFIIPLIGYIQGFDYQEMILTWLALTLLMIPCQPPIIITMALSFAAFMLARNKVVVKRLFGVEGIGQITAIVSDKTGTITENKMELETFITQDGAIKILMDDIQAKIMLALPDYASHVLDKAVYNALKIQTKQYKQVGFFGFSEQQSWRDLTYKNSDGLYIHALVASPEFLLERSRLSEDKKQYLLKLAKDYASLGYKLSAYAMLLYDKEQLDDLKGVEFLAIAVLKDPVRVGVDKALQILQHAGIKTCIVTGDHASTAQKVAQQVGLQGRVISGAQFDELTDEQVLQETDSSKIFARMNPTQKFRLVQILKQREHVAVIGDGVNDAPALKIADVGIAMGKIGTDLAKQVADLVITDDNYVHLTEAVKIGRTALENFKKGLVYYLGAKLILLILFIVSLILGVPFPFVPVQIILIELLLDVSSSTIFVVERPEQGVMHGRSQNIMDFLGMPLIYKIFKTGLPLALGVVYLYVKYYYQYGLITAQTVAFISWLIGHMFLALNVKQEHEPLIKRGLFANYFVLFWLFIMVTISIIVTNVSFLFPYVRTTYLSLFTWIELLSIVFITTFWIEAFKIMKNVRFKS